MGNRPASPAGVRGSGGNPKPGPGIVEGWRAVASFVVVLLTFAAFIWLMYEVVINDNDNAYCKVRPFFLPLCLLSFSILGVFIGGWAEASWNPPKNSPFSMLATKAGGGAAFFLIAAGVLWILSSRDDCPQSLAYTFSFEKPLEVPIEPDRDNARWYQHYPHNADVTHGKLFYATGEDATDLDPFQDLRFKLGLGKTGSVLCPISVRIYNRRKPFKGVCHDSGPADDLSFKLSQDLIAYASSLAAQAGNQAPREAADLGEPEAAEKDCFAEIRAAGQPVNRPYNQNFTRDGRNLRLGPHVTIHLYKGDICIENGSGKIVFPAFSASLSPPTFSWFRPLDYVVSSARAANSESCGETGPLESPPFEQLLESLASEEPDEATATLVANFRTYECKIYDVVLGSELGPSVISRLLRVISLAPVGWSNDRLIANDAFPDLRPNDKAKRVFDLVIEEFIISANDALRRQARRLLTTYPAKYVREKYAEIDIDQLSELQRLYLSYAGIFIYFKAVISGEHFDKSEMSPDIMSRLSPNIGRASLSAPISIGRTKSIPMSSILVSAAPSATSRSQTNLRSSQTNSSRRSRCFDAFSITRVQGQNHIPSTINSAGRHALPIRPRPRI